MTYKNLAYQSQLISLTFFFDPPRASDRTTVSVRLSQFRPSALAGPVRRTWVRVLTPEPSRVKSESADGAE